ncbi:MAG: YebC/PmpR family DNA-binding transcriptional regulator, partial [Desulfovibrionaceae bacterium]
AGHEPDEAELVMVPQNYIDVDAETARKILRLIDALEDNEDVQKVFFNAEFPDDVLEDM